MHNRARACLDGVLRRIMDNVTQIPPIEETMNPRDESDEIPADNPSLLFLREITSDEARVLEGLAALDALHGAEPTPRT